MYQQLSNAKSISYEKIAQYDPNEKELYAKWQKSGKIGQNGYPNPKQKMTISTIELSIFNGKQMSEETVEKQSL